MIVGSLTFSSSHWQEAKIKDGTKNVSFPSHSNNQQTQYDFKLKPAPSWILNMHYSPPLNR